MLKVVSTALGVFFGGIFSMLVIATIRAVIVWLLWNALMPELFGLTTVTIWQSIGMTWLLSFLFPSSK